MEVRDDGPQVGHSLNSEINVTPLVDVMLVVLIIFMVVTPLLQKGVGVDLPPARNVEAVPEDPSRILTVVLQGDGRMFLGTEPIDRASLGDALRLRCAADPARQLQVKADRTVRYQEIKEILAAGRAAGFRGAALIARAIEPAERAETLPGPAPTGQGD